MTVDRKRPPSGIETAKAEVALGESASRDLSHRRTNPRGVIRRIFFRLGSQIMTKRLDVGRNPTDSTYVGFRPTYLQI
jgi:hypothetical protein